MIAIRAAAVQFEHQPNDKNANLKIISEFVSEAAANRVDLIAFPECCITGYWHLRSMSQVDLTNLAETVPDGPASKELLRMARESSLTIGAGLIEAAGDLLFNTYVVAMPNGEIQKHRKLHAFVSPFISSGSSYTVFDIPQGCRVAVLTCYDNNIVENVRIVALQGAEVLLAPHQTGGCTSPDPLTLGRIDPALWRARRQNPGAIEKEILGPKGRDWLMRWLPSRAHDNGLYIVFSNGVGVDGDEIRTGNSMILDPYGRIQVESRKAGNDMVVAQLDGSLLERCLGRRWIQTRRPGLYAELAEETGKEKSTRDVRFDGKGV
jgi:predicted amidohydrolase